MDGGVEKEKKKGRDDRSESEDEKDRKRHKGKRLERHGSSESESDEDGRRKRHKKRKKRRRSSSNESSSGSDVSTSEESSSSEDERRRRRKKKEKKSREKKEKREKRKEKKKKKKEKVAKGPLTSRWGKYGIIKEIDMWNKRPEFSAWLMEVKKVNLESLDNREEKTMFKGYMEDYNTGTLPHKKYYDLMRHHQKQTAKAQAKDMEMMAQEKTVFNDEEEKRVELQRERAKRQEADLIIARRAMMEGRAEQIRELQHLQQQMQYHYRVGNTQAAEAIKRKLEPEDPRKMLDD